MALMNTTSRGKDLRGCLVAIRSSRAALRASEGRVADYVLEHAGDIVHSSVTELAQASGTSEATVVRFCRALGYRGFPEFKLLLARDLARQDGQPEPGGELSVSDSVDVVAGRVFHFNTQALIDTMELQQASALEHAVAALASAKRIVICGLGGSSGVVREAEYKFQLIGLNALAPSDAHMQRMAVGQLGPGDVVMGISHSGSTPEVVRVIEQAGELGATTIGVTNYAGSPLARASMVTLLTAGAEATIAGKRVALRLAEVGLIDAIFVAVALRRQTESPAMPARVARGQP